MKIDRLMAFGLNVGYMKTFKLKKKKKNVSLSLPVIVDINTFVRC